MLHRCFFCGRKSLIVSQTHTCTPLFCYSYGHFLGSFDRHFFFLECVFFKRKQWRNLNLFVARLKITFCCTPFLCFSYRHFEGSFDRHFIFSSECVFFKRKQQRTLNCFFARLKIILCCTPFLCSSYRHFEGSFDRHFIFFGVCFIQEKTIAQLKLVC